MVAATTAEALPASRLRIGGLTPLTTIDFPGKLAAVVFCQGCPWRCNYCHNTALLDATAPRGPSWADVERLLQARHGLLDAVVFSGGEPTLQAPLRDALVRVRELGYATGLHTAGMYPDRLPALLPWLDWVGLDIKAPSDRYDALTGAAGSGTRAWQSLELLLSSGVPLECRTTWHPELFDEAALLGLARSLRAQGVRDWVLQAGSWRGVGAWSIADDVLASLAEGFQHFTLRRP